MSLGESPVSSGQLPAGAAPPQRGLVVLLVAGTLGAAVITFALLSLRGGPSPTLSAAAGPRADGADSSAAGAAAGEITDTQSWSAENRQFWIGRQRGAAFQLLAENKVHTWFGPTQPVLVVRCVSKTLDTFVYTRSATRIEPHVEGKTVTVSIDDEPAQTERWQDSDDKVALFAPDGDALARRLLHAHTFRFGYSPHNADDVVAQFHVTGLARLLEPVARECGWKK